MDAQPAARKLLPYLPTLAPGETLYSWGATVHRRAVSANATEMSRRLFGSSHAARLHDFPARLAELTKSTRGLLGPPRDLALAHTLLGYYLPFCKSQTAEVLLEGVVKGSVPELKMRMGIPASGIGGYHPLRCCKECIQRDLMQIGWPIWHVHHQCPSSLVCVEHKRPLVQTWHQISPVHRREWLVPDASPGQGRVELAVANDKALDVMLRLAAFSTSIFYLPPGTLDRSTTNHLYRAWAEDHGGLTSDGNIRYATVNAQLRDRFQLIQVAFASLGPVACNLNLANIVSMVMRSEPKPAHPTKHLVLMTAMFPELSELTTVLNKATTALEHRAAGDSADASCAQKLGSIQTRRTAFFSYVETGKSISSAAASAGISVTTGVRWSLQNGVPFTSRAKVLKEEVLEKIYADIRLGYDRRQLAHRNGVSLSSIHRLFSSDHPLRDHWAEIRHQLTRHRHREKFLSAVSRNPTCTPKSLRHMLGGSWTWLYRHDRDWLVNSLPSLWSKR